MTGVTVTERKRSRRQLGKPKLIEFVISSTYPNSSAALVSLQTANPPKAFPQSITLLYILPSLTYTHPPCSLFFPPSSVPFQPSSPPSLYGFGQTWTSPLRCPASYESHGGQGPRGCQGLLMTPSSAITSGWQLYLHKTSRQCEEPDQSELHTRTEHTQARTHAHTYIFTVQRADMS